VTSASSPDTAGAHDSSSDATDELVPADETTVSPDESAAATDPADALDASPADATEPADAADSTEESPAEVTDPAEAGEPSAVREDAEESTEQDAAEAVAATPAAPVPAPVPSPRPGPRPGARVAAPTEPWGRVDDEGTVSVREVDGWRVVGQYPDGTPAEALAYFERKFADLASEVTLLEVRHRRGGASASDLRATALSVRGKLDGAAAVGDLATLIARIDALTAELAEASESEAAAAKEAVAEAVRERTVIVEEAEALAARDPQTVQWKQSTADMSALFDRWQAHQQNGPRLPKSTAQQLWRRFRDARASFDRHRREFFSALDDTHKAARDVKTRLVERAEALAPRGEDGIGAYRDLLDEWKASGRAGRKVDDALWARFKAAGDALYGARGEREAADIEASREKIEQKRALLEQAAPIVDEKNLATARQRLTAIQRQWDEIGRVFPRDVERGLDDELRKIEQSVRTREDADWKRNDPEQKARANDMTRQITDAIAKLESELADAEARGDKRAAAQASEALEARRGWLRALGG